jgi:methionine-rich copper-binding protein CopC
VRPGAAAAAAAALGLALLLPGVSRAHSLLLSATPAAASAGPAPAEVQLRFNNRIEKRLSRVRILDAGGKVIAAPAVAPDGPADRLTAALPPLAAGAYRLEWQVMSGDGHVVQGGYRFTVAPR